MHSRRYLLLAPILGALATTSCFLSQPVVPDGSVVRAPNEWICFVQNDRLRHIPDMPTFNNLGFVPADITPITNDQFGSIKEGAPMPHLDSRLLRGPQGQVYLMVHGTRRLVPNPLTLANLALTQPAVNVSNDFLTSLSEGPPLPVVTSRLIRAPDGHVYVITSGMFRYVPDTETLTNLCLTQSVVDVPPGFMASLPIGPPLPHNSKRCGA
jgi:hypothetical protein